jgi:hypothetical protein
MAADAFMDASGQWHDGFSAAQGTLTQAPTAGPVYPDPLAGHRLAVRYGPVVDDDKVSLYTLHLQGDGMAGPREVIHPG